MNKLTLHAVAIEAAQSLKAMSDIQKGMETQQDELDLLKTSISDHVMIAARSHKLDFESFGKEYKQECTWLKSAEGTKETGVDLGGKIPRHFIQANSDVRKGMELGIDPNSYDTYNSFKMAKLDAAKVGKKETDNKEGDNVLQGDDNLLSQPVSALLAALKEVSEDNYGKAVAVIEETIKNIQLLSDVVPVAPVKAKAKAVAKANTKKKAA